MAESIHDKNRQEENSMTTLQIIGGPLKGKAFNLEGETVFIGRSSKNDIQIKDATISRKQIKLYRIGAKLFLEDLKSTNGSWLNDSLVLPGEGFEVGEGDIITLGNTVMLITDTPSPLAPEAADKPLPKTKTVTEGPSRLEKERREKLSGNLELIYSVSKLIRSSLSLREMLDRVLESVLETLPRIDRATLVLLDTEKQEIRDIINRSREDKKDTGRHYSRTVVDRVIRERKAVRMSNTTFEAPSDLSASVDTLEVGSLLCVPLMSNETTYGVLYVDSLSQPYGFRKDDLLLLNAMSGALALSIENAQLKNDSKDR
jgi:pSer/pThr/pTyr-binding forkhead associated (FHA) protein